ncbi:MAG: ribosome small subunit-dependent GTPase A [Clostridia bacterium]|nr:ribosome small subunit-dependent GTPase A [Clostridia bacterium]
MIISGIVTKSVGGLFTVSLDSEYNGKKTVDAHAKGAFKHEKITLLAGDRVEISVNENGELYISKILERKSSLIRPPLANLDYIFVVISCVKPAPVLETIDKLICIAESKGIECAIVITKSDLDMDFAKSTAQIYKKSGFETFVTSSENGEGKEEIYNYIRAKCQERENPIFAFSGASGAGKSTFINLLFPDLALEIGDLSRKNERGKNTTRKTELFSLETLIGDGIRGYLADTPGFTLLDFERFDFFELEQLFDTFREFRESKGKCRFTKCSHTKEQGCDVLRRVSEGEIPKTRHASYVALYNILKSKPKWKK